MEYENNKKKVEIQLQLTDYKQKTNRSNKRKLEKEVKNKTLDKDYFQKVVECENKILKGFNRDNLFEILELYKVNKNN